MYIQNFHKQSKKYHKINPYLNIVCIVITNQNRNDFPGKTNTFSPSVFIFPFHSHKLVSSE